MTAAASGAAVAAPGYWRRLASFAYEGVVLFGVVMIAGYVYARLTQQRHALQGTAGLQLLLFVVLGIYFTWFWTHGGQTVAMKTWRIRLLMRDGSAITPTRAVLRYLLCWMWFLPGLFLVHLADLKGSLPIASAVLTGVLAYGGLSLLRADGQYWHDVACGTVLADLGDRDRAG